MKKKILLLTCGSNAGYHFSRIIKKYFNELFTIIGTDINDAHMVASINNLEGFYKVPYSSNKEFYQTILNICRKERIHYLVPIFDIDQKLFYAENKDLSKLNVHSLAISQKIFDVYDNKQTMVKFLESINIPTPKLFEISHINISDDYFIKPKNGFGSKGVSIISGKNLLKLKNPSYYIIQEVCSLPEITLEVFNFNKKVSTVARERIATTNGVCTKAKVYHDNYLEQIAYKLTTAINLPYYFNLQFMTNRDRQLVVTDVNLRFAAGMSMSYAAGWDVVSSIANILLENNDNIFSTLKLNTLEKFVVRTYKDIVVSK